jgi:hypothetical protein
LAPSLKETTVETTEELEWGPENAKSLPLLPGLQGIYYGTSQLLSDLSVEPTPSNAQLFQICKQFNELAKI